MLEKIFIINCNHSRSSHYNHYCQHTKLKVPSFIWIQNKLLRMGRSQQLLLPNLDYSATYSYKLVCAPPIANSWISQISYIYEATKYNSNSFGNIIHQGALHIFRMIECSIRVFICEVSASLRIIIVGGRVSNQQCISVKPLSPSCHLWSLVNWMWSYPMIIFYYSILVLLAAVAMGFTWPA